MIKPLTNRENTSISNLINDMGYEGYGIFRMLMELMPVYGYCIPCCYRALGIRMNADPDKIKSVAEKYGLFSVGAEYYGSKTMVISPAPDTELFAEYMKTEDELWRVLYERLELEKLEYQNVNKPDRQKS